MRYAGRLMKVENALDLKNGLQLDAPHDYSNCINNFIPQKEVLVFMDEN